MFAKYHITTFCAPPTMYRMLTAGSVAVRSFLHPARDDGRRGAQPRGLLSVPQSYRPADRRGLRPDRDDARHRQPDRQSHEAPLRAPPPPPPPRPARPPAPPPPPGAPEQQQLQQSGGRAPCPLVSCSRPRRGMARGGDPGRPPPRGAMRTASTGMSAARTTSSSPPATASGRSRSKTSSWSCRMCSNAAFPPRRTRSAGRSSRPPSSSSPAPRARTS